MFGIVDSSASAQTTSDSIHGRQEGAELTFNLLEGADCVVSGSATTSFMRDSTEVVSVNNQVYDSSFFVQASRGNRVTLSCRIDEIHGLLDLELGVPDNIQRYDSVMAVNIYQGGNVIYNYRNLRAGSKIVSVLNLEDPEILSNPNSIAVELICSSGYRCQLHAIEATLYPASNTTSFSNPTLSSDSSSAPDDNQESNRPWPGSTRTDASPEGGILDSITDQVEETIEEGIENGIRDIFESIF